MATPDASAPSSPNVGRVLRIAGGTYDVDTADGVIRCSLRGRIKQKDRPIVAVGDRVELERVGEDARITEILPRHGALTRHGVAKRREQVIVANVDQVSVVAALRSPDPDLLMLDRLLALAELNAIDAFLVVNKVDLGDPEELPAAFEAYERTGYEVLRASAERGSGLDPFAERLAGRITVLTGQSGVGKSSLLNAVMPELELRVGEMSGRGDRGRHTTVAAALYPYAGGGYVADTPGLQYLALWGVDPAELDDAFRDIAPHAGGCRFADCRHRAEPGCAVREAVERGEIAERRYESYLGLLAEAEGE